jgi:hypothetical protein
MRLLKLLALTCLLTACGAAKSYRINNNSYEEVTMPVKNICFFMQDFERRGKVYQQFEAYLREELGKRAVDAHFVYYVPSDSLAQQKLRDSVYKYGFDFIIKETMEPNSSGNTNIFISGSPPSINSPGTPISLISFNQKRIDMYFMGYRKKDAYQLVWKASCENMRNPFLGSFPKIAGECLLNSLIAQKLIPEKTVGEQ